MHTLEKFAKVDRKSHDNDTPMSLGDLAKVNEKKLFRRGLLLNSVTCSIHQRI